jgi:hypothetical protein
VQERELKELKEERVEKFPMLHWLITRIHDIEVLYLKNKCVYDTFYKKSPCTSLVQQGPLVKPAYGPKMAILDDVNQDNALCIPVLQYHINYYRH